jgi:hypothetical protein
LNCAFAQPNEAHEFVRHTLPSVEEMRMVRAIERTALREAARLGTYQAYFHGFHIYAKRIPALIGVFVSISVVFGVTRCVSELTLSLDSLEDCFVLPAQSRDKYYVLQMQEPIACAQVR